MSRPEVNNKRTNLKAFKTGNLIGYVWVMKGRWYGRPVQGDPLR